MRVALSVLLLARVGVAIADPVVADKLAGEANTLATQGLYKAAAAKFADAYREDSARPELFCNVGISYYKADELARAHLLLKRCLDLTALDAKFVDAAQAVVKAIEETLRAGGHTPVTVTVNPTGTAITILEWGTDEAFIGGRLVWLPFGTYHFTARFEGYEDQNLEVKTTNPAKQDVSITMRRKDGSPAIPPKRTRHLEGSKRGAIIVTSVTSVLLVGSIVAHFQATSAADDADGDVQKAQFKTDRERMTKWNTFQGAAGIAAALGAGLAGYLWFRAIHGREVSLELLPGPGGGTATLTTAF